jgi:NAD(P)-dependent dehydrogenase (short-subunit alcohol dehydrogenase family)
MNKPEVVVITGASAGVGRATAREFGRHGAHVALLARGAAGLERAKEEIEALGGKALVIPTDVADHNQVDAAAEATRAAFGPIDVWINNAMVSVFSPVSRMLPEEYKRVTEVTYLGAVYGTLAALKDMAPRNQGTIVQVGSALAYRSIPLQSAYCAAKHALVGFTDSLRSELLHDKLQIRLTAVHLPAMNTPQFDWVKSRLPRRPQPVPPIFQPEVAARAIYWAAHNERREVLVGGSTLTAVVGQKVIPGVFDNYLAQFGYDGQQADEADQPQRPNNLYNPLPGDAGAHGRFDDRAHAVSCQFEATSRRKWIGLAAVVVSAAAALLAGRKPNQHLDNPHPDKKAA